ncbi:MAG: hypothetical protein ACJ8BC_09480 [Gemmatimonadales bacterium]
MSSHEEGIIREAAKAALMARRHGCNIDVRIKRWGHSTEVGVHPSGEATVTIDDDDQDTQIIATEEYVSAEKRGKPILVDHAAT